MPLEVNFKTTPQDGQERRDSEPGILDLQRSMNLSQDQNSHTTTQVLPLETHPEDRPP